MLGDRIALGQDAFAVRRVLASVSGVKNACMP